MMVFYIDDDADDLDFFREVLSDINADIQCVTYTKSKEAMIALLNGEVLPDLILLDINMPLMNGKECLIEIKNNQRLKSVPVVMCSTTLNTAEMKPYFQLGAYDFIVKPSSMGKYETELRAILESLHTAPNNNKTVKQKPA